MEHRGYSPNLEELHLSKIEVALHQLDASIAACLVGDYIISVTLAGAAEEIFGALCKRRNIENAVELLSDQPLLKKVGNSKQERISYLNHARNCLKHANSANEDEFVISKLDSLILIARALGNARLLGIECVDGMRQYQFLQRKFMNPS